MGAGQARELWGSVKSQFRIEMLNVGTITAQAGFPRMTQFILRLYW
jgi:hypothetical protein